MTFRLPKFFFTGLFAPVLVCAAPSAAQAGDPEAGARMAVFCAYCHGLDGNPFDDEAPRLAGQSESALVAKMNQPALYQNQSHFMLQTFLSAGCMRDKDVENLAAFYARQPVHPRTRSAIQPPRKN
jgi:cytochrome c553